MACLWSQAEVALAICSGLNFVGARGIDVSEGTGNVGGGLEGVAGRPLYGHAAASPHKRQGGSGYGDNFAGGKDTGGISPGRKAARIAKTNLAELLRREGCAAIAKYDPMIPATIGRT